MEHGWIKATFILAVAVNDLTRHLEGSPSSQGGTTPKFKADPSSYTCKSLPYFLNIKLSLCTNYSGWCVILDFIKYRLRRAVNIRKRKIQNEKLIYASAGNRTSEPLLSSVPL